jgi:hypothetical protein
VGWNDEYVIPCVEAALPSFISVKALKIIVTLSYLRFCVSKMSKRTRSGEIIPKPQCEYHLVSVQRTPMKQGLVKTKKTVRFNFAPLDQYSAVSDILVEVDRVVTKVFDDFYTEENALPNDVVGLTLRATDDPQNNAFHAFAQIRNNPAQKLMKKIERALQSNAKLLLNEWIIDFLLIPKPRGHGNRRKTFYNASIQNATKKSIVQINNEDKLYLWRAIVVAKASRDQKMKTITRNQYKSTCNSQIPKQGRLARELKEATSTDSGDTDDILTISRHLKMNITVVQPILGNDILFRTADSTVCLICCIVA